MNSCIRILADDNQINQCKANVAAMEKEIFQLSGLLQMAGNEVRLKILFLLHQENQMCPCDLSDVLGMTVPAISQHLRKMKDKDLVKFKKVGQTIFYYINEAHLALLEPFFLIIKNPVKA